MSDIEKEAELIKEPIVEPVVEEATKGDDINTTSEVASKDEPKDETKDETKDKVEDGNTEEQERLKKLEEARKKVEALRNKKKGKKTKKKESTPSPAIVNDNGEAANVVEDSKIVPEISKETLEVDSSSPSTTAKDDSDNLFPSEPTSQTGGLGVTDSTDDFLATIQKEQESFELEQCKKKILEMEKEIKNLKFTNMEHETTIDDLQDEISDLKKDISTTKEQLKNATVLSNAPTLNKTPSTLQLSNFSSQQQQQQHQQQPQQQLQYAPAAPSSLYIPQHASSGQQSPVQPVDLELLHSKWKNWNVDMTTWRSIGTGPIVPF